jgi:hypothetical protein
MKLLLTIASTEWDGGSGSWRPIEDAAAADSEFHGLFGPEQPHRNPDRSQLLPVDLAGTSSPLAVAYVDVIAARREAGDVVGCSVVGTAGPEAPITNRHVVAAFTDGVLGHNSGHLVARGPRQRLLGASEDARGELGLLAVEDPHGRRAATGSVTVHAARCIKIHRGDAAQDAS